MHTGIHISFISKPKFNLYQTAVSNWFAPQACKPKLPVDRHIQSHFKISIYNISNWISIKLPKVTNSLLAIKTINKNHTTTSTSSQIILFPGNLRSLNIKCKWLGIMQ